MAKRNNLVTKIPDPKTLKLLFDDTRLSFLWLIVRVYVGWQWAVAGYEKIINPLWVGDKAGFALHGYVLNSLTKSMGAHPDVQSWYAGFLHNVVLPNSAPFSYIVAYGELLVGVGLIIGLFTGIAAFFGLFMNLNYLLAGTVSVNPVLFVLEIFLIFAWRVSGWWGLDRFFLPLLGTPWKPGKIFRRKK